MIGLLGALLYGAMVEEEAENKIKKSEPMVRCKDCKYFEEIMTARYRDGTTKEVQICKKRVPLKDENFYCGWGERKESEEVTP